MFPDHPQQVPFILAWALSVHKSQGQTLERVKVDLRRTFEKGQGESDQLYGRMMSDEFTILGESVCCVVTRDMSRAVAGAQFQSSQASYPLLELQSLTVLMRGDRVEAHSRVLAWYSASGGRHDRYLKRSLLDLDEEMDNEEAMTTYYD